MNKGVRSVIMRKQELINKINDAISCFEDNIKTKENIETEIDEYDYDDLAVWKEELVELKKCVDIVNKYMREE